MQVSIGAQVTVQGAGMKSIALNECVREQVAHADGGSKGSPAKTPDCKPSKRGPCLTGKHRDWQAWAGKHH
eukprot:1144409-Pelagomonas_calceolata.AAC.5